MKQYLKMADVFRDEMRVVGDSKNMLADDVGIIIGCYSGDKMAEYVLHAINSHDELVQMNQELMAALEGAETSLEAISFLDSKPEMRSYAGSRASVAMAAIAKAKGGAE